ncbi:hypothetical protein BGZ83_005989 [Gryganskiella cystojenkinii]|nr:hypothetical protein BGZ83_005989 [Gryganskiella cystojenkinii]
MRVHHARTLAIFVIPPRHFPSKSSMRLISLLSRSLSIAALAILSTIQAVPAGPVNLQKRALHVNDWSCKPSAAKPYPLVLVHGTFMNAVNTWAFHGPRFLAKGYCVFQLNYGFVPLLPGIGGLTRIESSAKELDEFVDKVLAATKASQVDMLGHSQGGLMPLYYMKRLGGAAKVHKIGALAPATRGTTASGLVNMLREVNIYDTSAALVDKSCQSCGQMIHDSPFLTDLYTDGDTSPGVEYFFLATKYDAVVSPYTNSFLQQKNAKVTNVAIQEYCAFDRSGHGLLLLNVFAFNIMDNFFSPPPTPRTLNCLPF